MKVIIEFDGLKRTIDGDFRLCGDAAVLRFMAEQIIKATDGKINEETGCGTYGWIEVRDPMPHDPRADNCPPIAWRIR